MTSLPRRLLVAQRGEIALRIIGACDALGIETVLAASAADLDSLPARRAGRTVCVGEAPATQSYLLADAMVHAALATGCDALHPGYGFLSENAGLARTCADEGLIFVGPSARHLVGFGDKVTARRLAGQAGVPLLPGRSVDGVGDALAVAEELGYPLLLKAAHGGGGKGIRIVRSQAELRESFPVAASEAVASFGDGRLYVERYVAAGKHLEVQIAGDRHATTIHLGERECSLQYGYQKLLEESPSPSLTPRERADLLACAVALGGEVGYDNLGTVEFLFDVQRRELFFLEVNPRIQVEHPVTEAVTGVDLVQEQIRIACGQPLSVAQRDVAFDGHAIECRVNAQIPTADGLLPRPGRIDRWEPPDLPGVRVDSHCFSSYLVPPYYDALLAKVIAHAGDRPAAIALMRDALDAFVVDGVPTTISLHQTVLAHPAFAAGEVTTSWLDEELADLLMETA
ncbi:acetyl-CoA carboxylase biotin carboxylase subunit [Capillimicrobium parvum]|uniref:biotin carboxylase n=1 Tax=Capillimicrobium parvum TaxID=2884022 RepID=A0A9E6XU27_9ACTN|nr:biotin carboxylase N-terminal domain-containing protein [Capillimicrobium parvum]UGS34399.1 Biotin carboxylase [Capillimicrobium parvum]